jgi:hypothetical protein
MALTDSTTRILKLVDHDAQYEMTETRSGIEPIILNKSDLSDPNYIDRLSDLIFSDGAGADFIAKCQCGETEGNNKVGMICPFCDTEVSKKNILDEDNLVCRNWLSCPKELPNGWLTPKIYLMLASWLSYDKGKRNYIDDILDVETPIPFEIADVVKGKGFAYFYDNFDRIIIYFIVDHPTFSKKPETISMKYCLTLYRDRIWCHYIPILNSAINPIITNEGTGSSKKRYSDVTADHILSAGISLSRLEFSNKKRDHMRHVERTAFKAYKDIINYFEESTKKYISTKKAIPRTHIFGSRFHWSFRGVIVPIVGPHMYYELHIPWRMAVNTLRVHIKGILMREYQMNISDTEKKVREALNRVDPDIKQIMDRLIEESPFPGLPCLWDRPPSIRDGSVMLKFWTVIKTDLDDSSIGMSPLDVALPNADFDGDSLAGILIPETEMVKSMRNLSPSALIYNRNTGEVSSEIGIHKTCAITWNSFLGSV